VRLPHGSKSWSTLGYNEVRRQPNQFCSVCALAAYIGCPAIIYADIIERLAVERVGLDPKLFAGHSLRAGFLTSAAKRGASIFKMMDVSRHRSVDTLRGYIRDAELFQDHAGSGLL
jgi:hypothetical protein